MSEKRTTFWEIEVVPHDAHWPAMVRLEIDAGTVLPHDARVLGKALIEAAERADALNDAATQAVEEVREWRKREMEDTHE